MLMYVVYVVYVVYVCCPQPKPHTNICVHTNSVWLFPVWIQPSARIRDCDLHIANYQQLSMRKSSPRSDIAQFSKMANYCSQNRSIDLNACHKTGNKRQQS